MGQRGREEKGKEEKGRDRPRERRERERRYKARNGVGREREKLPRMAKDLGKEQGRMGPG